jgi:hypothetical protein
MTEQAAAIGQSYCQNQRFKGLRATFTVPRSLQGIYGFSRQFGENLGGMWLCSGHQTRYASVRADSGPILPELKLTSAAAASLFYGRVL